MAEKELGESDWKAFAAKNGIKDGAMPKALAQLARAEKQTRQDQLDALDAVDKARGALAREHKANKVVAKQLDDIERAIGRARKDAEKAAKDAAKDSADEEEDSPALLTSKMIPLLRELRKGELTMPALVTTAGKATAVLISRRSISPSRRKMMLEAVGAQGGAKHIMGECLLEEGKLTFVVQSPAGGLARRIREALLAQTGQRLKVRVRGDDGAAEEDGEDEAGEASAAPAAPGAAAASPAAATPPEGAAPASPAPSPAARAYAEREPQVAARVEAALKAQHAQSTKLRALIGFASEKAEAGDAAAALKALDMIEQLLGAAAGAPPGAPAAPATPAAPPGVDPAAAFNARLAALMPRIKEAIAGGHGSSGTLKVRVADAGALAKQRDYAGGQQLLDEVESLLAAPGSSGGGAGLAAWQAARQAAVAQLKALQTNIAAMKHPRGNAAIVLVRAIQANLTARPDTPAMVAELERYLSTDDIIEEAERPNGFGITVKLREPLLAALQQLKAEMV